MLTLEPFYYWIASPHSKLTHLTIPFPCEGLYCPTVTHLYLLSVIPKGGKYKGSFNILGSNSYLKLPRLQKAMFRAANVLEIFKLFDDFHKVYACRDDDKGNEEEEEEDDDGQSWQLQPSTGRVKVYGVLTSLPDTMAGKSESKRHILTMERFRLRGLYLQSLYNPWRRRITGFMIAPDESKDDEDVLSLRSEREWYDKEYGKNMWEWAEAKESREFDWMEYVEEFGTVSHHLPTALKLRQVSKDLTKFTNPIIHTSPPAILKFNDVLKSYPENQWKTYNASTVRTCICLCPGPCHSIVIGKGLSNQISEGDSDEEGKERAQAPSLSVSSLTTSSLYLNALKPFER
ncbi:hypothetical protein M422DRAFT_269169 [Sphaerobolus stellatus SS14]|uniref:Uncharacterized protein n=1 Tax=Sphaerobolus stellatus (strain SS14) TaxID=990650 RepID=A0A0C9UKV5_SPHS4|nr:hypothetical protein M422DRAFT_269169 [Sphaerobolus stellatus SS14]